ncbi:MAG: hypothetical protein M3R54_08210 [Chloroflexota bacterium]|nr:hypothetical protein [Chloroflexota bacterium]
MGIIELLIVILLLLWLFGYFGRGRLFGARGGGPALSTGSFDSGNWVHILLLIVVILVVLRLLGVA